MFPIRDAASCPPEFSMSLLCSFHTDVRTTMIDTHASNWGGQRYGLQQIRWFKGLAHRSDDGTIPIRMARDAKENVDT